MESTNVKDENYEVNIDKLKEQFAELIAEYTDIICRQYNRLMAEYLKELGELEYEEYITRIEAMEIKSKMSLMMERMNMGEQINKEEISKQAQESVKEQKEKAKCMENDMKLSKEIISKKKLAGSEIKELKNICKEIIIRIHPDIKEEITENDKELWNDAMEAYKKEDIKELKSILKKVSEVNNVANELGKIKGLNTEEGNCDELKKKVDEYIYRIKEARKLFPFNKEEFLQDKEKVAKRKYELEEKLRVQKDYIDELRRKYEFMISAL